MHKCRVVWLINEYTLYQLDILGMHKHTENCVWNIGEGQPKWDTARLSTFRGHSIKCVLLVITKPPEDTFEQPPKSSNNMRIEASEIKKYVSLCL